MMQQYQKNQYNYSENRGKGKYAAEVGITGIDYTEHRSNKLLLPDYVPDLELLLGGLHMMINI